MLRQTFIHIPGIGRRTEQDLWNLGVTSWGHFDRTLRQPVAISAGLRRRLEAFIPKSFDAVQRKDAAFFSRLSRMGEAWRVFPDFADRCVYLDIETTGLSPVFDTVTMVGLYDGRRYETFIDGQNLHDLPFHLKKYSVVVTFNGAGFDLRFLKLAFANLELPPIHIDLRWVTRRLHVRGGLKAVEREFGISRDQSVDDIDGHEATVLWARHLRGDKDALRRLISYNREDVVHLKAIMELTYDRLSAEIGAPLPDRKRMYVRVGALPRLPEASKRRIQIASGKLVDRLLARSHVRAPRIVGIDLTGSERRASGWAILEDDAARTKSILTNEDLVRETLAAKADIVSIDSPLSVPEGWTCEQKQLLKGAPIYRKCELALKRMGISVFWCLLPSMQSLTRRGMLLADQLRQKGVRVIESYPGAAQDILGIPRKGASLEELKLGLHRAGISGAFLDSRVTHDEVDAITSALVGLFYLANDFIALGTPKEDYLIVPRSPKINYSKLAEILAATGLDGLTASSSGGSAHELNGGPAAIPAFA